MPTYGRKKVKDMVRSVLPSKLRTGARLAKQEMHQNSRRENRQNVSPMAQEPELYEDYLDDTKWVKKQTRMNVAIRRDGDKVKPLMRWAPKVTRGQHDRRLAQLRAMMPANLIGEHAIGHVRSLEQFENPNDPMILKYGRRSERLKQKQKVEESVAVRLRKMLEKEPWLHADLNEWIRSHHRTNYVQTGTKSVLVAPGKYMEQPTYGYVGVRHARVLRGFGDIKDFVAELEEAARWCAGLKYDWKGYHDNEGKYHPEWLEALKSFVAENYPPK